LGVDLCFQDFSQELTVAKDHPWDVSGSAVPRLTRAR
jgi:hypothetical protein